jgi:hypothetical protein
MVSFVAKKVTGESERVSGKSLRVGGANLEVVAGIPLRFLKQWQTGRVMRFGSM